MKRQIGFVLYLLLSFFMASAQQFGGFPPSTRWQQINTDTTRILFAAPVREDAQRIASIIHQAARQTVNPLGDRLRKVNIVLHHQTTLANGYVGLGPFRSEYYLVPGSNLFEFGNLPWYEQLAVHEYRHVQQYSNFRNGLTNVFYVFAGEEGQALANSLSVPDWFFEGDAVYAETILTSQGRGRTPYFFNPFKSMWTSGRNYNWMKLRNGSFRDLVPNHYDLGYLLVNYGYQKYGSDFWHKVTQDASSFRGLFYPLQNAIKRNAGINYKIFRNDALNYYKQQVPQSVTAGRAVVTNYYFPYSVGHDSLLYVKDSYKNLAAFYLRDQKGEHRIKLKNISAEDWFSYRNGLIAYTSYSTHPRWSLKDYSDIILVNTATGQETRLTKRAKYFTPDIAPSGTKLAAVYVNDTVQTTLQVLDVQTGHVLQSFPAPEDVFFFHPRFIDEENILLGYRLPNATVAFYRLNTTTGKSEELLPPTSATIGYPFISNGNVYFTASLNGNDDIYALSLKEKKLVQMTTGQTGNYYPSVSGDSLYWSHFTINGLQLQSAAISSLNTREISTTAFRKAILPFPVAAGSPAINILNTPEKRYAIKRYGQTFHFFNFHSWRPYYEDPEITFSVYSNNVLNTFSNELYYKYNINEESHAVGLNTAYSGFFPVLTGGGQYTFDRHLKTIVGFGTPAQRIINYTLNELEPYVGFYIPLNFTQGNTYKSLAFGSSLVWDIKNITGIYKDSFRVENIAYLSHALNWIHQLPKARQQIYPSFGYTLSTNYKDQMDGQGYQVLGNGNIYLPAPFRTHSIQLSGSFQQSDTAYLFSDRFSNARGYDEYYFSRMWRGSANYHFPLLYPEFGIANIVYLMRIRGNVFYDYSRVYSNDKSRSRDLRSTGGELFFETKWWNQLPVTIGLRISHLLDNDFTTSKPAGTNVFEVVLPVSIIPR